jgi:protein SCO1/2
MSGGNSKTCIFSVLALFLSVSVVRPLCGQSRLAVIRPAPDFQLTDADGKPVSLGQYRGKVVLVSFIFTTCNGSCPATTHRLAKLRQELARHPNLDNRVQLLSITLDPERDTPEKLRRYMELFEIDGRRWAFATGEPAAVGKVIAAWDMWVRPTANSQLDHPSRVFLVDPHQQLREIYNLDFLRVPWVIEDIQLLLQDKEPRTKSQEPNKLQIPKSNQCG